MLETRHTFWNLYFNLKEMYWVRYYARHFQISYLILLSHRKLKALKIRILILQMRKLWLSGLK